MISYLCSKDHFINRERLIKYSILMIVVFSACAGFLALFSKNGFDAAGKPLGYDFITFYAASQMAKEGRAVEAFQPEKINEVESQIVPGNSNVFLWHYPPTYQLIVTPLAYVGYFQAYFLFISITFVAFLALMLKIHPDRLTILLCIAFPVAALNAFHGQNAFLNTALFGFAFLFIDRRPLLAGILFGLLSYKPHLGILVPLVLMVGGYWRVIFSAAITTLLFAGLVTLVYGPDYWLAFFRNLSLVAMILENGFLPWHKMPTIFAFFALLGAPTAVAYALHALVALAVGAATVFAWWRGGPLDLRIALVAIATVLISPYIFDYDLVLYAIPIALLARDDLQAGQPVRGRVLMLVAGMAPLFVPGMAEWAHIQVLPFISLTLFALCWVRLAEARQRSGEISRTDGAAYGQTQPQAA